jgi:hypothetical protein
VNWERPATLADCKTGRRRRVISNLILGLWGLEMIHVASRFAVAAMVGWLASSCAVTDHFDNRVSTFDIASEKARDEMILTNIARASRAEPLAFLQVGQITGSNTSSAQMGLPSLVLGPGVPATGTTALAHALDKQVVFGANPGQSGFLANGVTTSGSTTFNVTPSETKDFYRGLLLTVEPETLAFFIEQGIANETLFYLFTEKVVEEKGGAIHQYVNDPLDPNFDKFQHYVALAMTYGLAAEPVPGAKPPKPTKSDKRDSGEDAEAPDWRLCFDRSAWAPGTPAADNHPMCGSREKSADQRIVTFRDTQGQLVKLRVFPRSTFSIFQYLGRIVAAGEAGQIKLRTEQAIGHAPLQDDTLFTVASGSSGDCFLAISYGHGYCVPEEALNTKRILGLLAQLLALNTSVRDVAITPQVQLLPQ